MTASRLHPRAFWFLRHGETDWNAQGLSQGKHDIPLNPTGQDQARSAALLMRSRGVRTIVTSPLSRALDTAQAVADALGLPVHTDPALSEVDFGVRDGTPMGPWFEEWVEERDTPEGGESFAALRDRAVGAFNAALAREAPVLVVAHAALFRAVRAEMGLPRNVRTPNGLPLFCEPGAPWTLTAAT